MALLNKEFAKKTALIVEGKHPVTYGELIAYKEAALYEITAKVPQGSVVALLGGYNLKTIAVLFALAELKHILIPVTEASRKEFLIRAEEGAIEWLVDGSHSLPFSIDSLNTKRKEINLYDKLRESNHSGLVLFSSGTTGKPKAMLHNLDALLIHYEGRRPKPIVTMALLHFDHIGGLNTLFHTLAIGGTLVAPECHDPVHIASLIEGHKVQLLPASPSFLNLLLLSEAAKQHDLSSLRMITYGTEPMPAALLARLKTQFPKTKFLQTFGTSETGIARTSSKSSDSVFMRFDDPDLEHKIVEGELWLRSKTQILGYLNAPMERFTPDGWFRTGDTVSTDQDGYLYIPGRASQTINVGGLKVEPVEVESVLHKHENVFMCKVYGISNGITGQVVAADIVLAVPEAESVARASLRQHCKRFLEPYKVPVKYTITRAIELSDRLKKPIH